MVFLHPEPKQLQGQMKMKKGVFGPVNTYFIQVHRRELKFLESENATKAALVLTLDKAKVRTGTKKGTVILTVRSIKYTLFCHDSTEADEWFQSLYISAKWKLETYYTLSDQVLGSGQYGVVTKATMTHADEEVAVKMVSKKQNKPRIQDFIDREYAIIAKLQHGNVVSTLDVFEDDDRLACVMEVMKGGCLSNYVAREKPLSETDAAHVMHDLLNAVMYIHKNNVVHRDIKPDNILICTTAHPLRAKITDFGLAKFIDSPLVDSSDLPLSGVGTIQFAAPEVIRQENYGVSADIWSCGVVCYFVLSGKLPFASYHKDVTKKKIQACDYSFPAESFAKVSAAAKRLIQSLLDPDKNSRISAKQALQHPWFREHFYAGPLLQKSWVPRTSQRLTDISARLESSVDTGSEETEAADEKSGQNTRSRVHRISSIRQTAPPNALGRLPSMTRKEADTYSHIAKKQSSVSPGADSGTKVKLRKFQSLQPEHDRSFRQQANAAG